MKLSDLLDNSIVDQYFDEIQKTGKFTDHGDYTIEDFAYDFEDDQWWDIDEEGTPIIDDKFWNGFKDWLKLRYNYVIKQLNKDVDQKPIKVYRSLLVDQDWFPKSPLGIYWSTSSGVIPYGATPDNSKKEVVLEAIIQKNDIDWIETIRSRMDYLNGDVEHEIQIKPGTNIQLIDVAGIDNFEPGIYQT